TAAVQASRSRRRRREETTAGTTRPAADPSAIHRSSLTTAPADCQRSSGSLARQVLTTRSNAGGVMGWIAEIGGGSAVLIEGISDARLAPGKDFFTRAL